jgi:hypothetical protein
VLAYEANTATSVSLSSGIAASARGVTVYAQTTPRGAEKSIEVLYSTDSFATQSRVAMSFDRVLSGKAQWLATIPSRPPRSAVTWYVEVKGYDSTVLRDPQAGTYDYVSY